MSSKLTKEPVSLTPRCCGRPSKNPIGAPSEPSEPLESSESSEPSDPSDPSELRKAPLLDEQAQPEKIGKGTPRREIPKRACTEKPQPQPQPPQPPPSQGVKRKRKSGRPRKEEQLFAVRDILDESETAYLIDWDDDPKTGEIYEPTWEPKEYAELGAVLDWERAKAKKEATKVREEATKVRKEAAKVKKEAKEKNWRTLQSHKQSPAGKAWRSPNTTQESEPVRGATRRRSQRRKSKAITAEGGIIETQESQDSQPVRPAKRRRTSSDVHERDSAHTDPEDTSAIPETQSQPEGDSIRDTDAQEVSDQSATLEAQAPLTEDANQETDLVTLAIPVPHIAPEKLPPATPPSFSISEVVSDYPKEIDDSFEATTQATQAQNQQLKVSLAVPEGFDRDEYLRFSQISSEFASQRSPAERSQVRSQSVGEKLQRVVRYHQDLVIPDSQEVINVDTPESRRPVRSKTWPETPERRNFESRLSPDHDTENGSNLNEDDELQLIGDTPSAEADSNVIQPETSTEVNNSLEQSSTAIVEKEISYQGPPASSPTGRPPFEDSWLTTKLVPTQPVEEQLQDPTVHEEEALIESRERSIEIGITPEPASKQVSRPSTPKTHVPSLLQSQDPKVHEEEIPVPSGGFGVENRNTPETGLRQGSQPLTPSSRTPSVFRPIVESIDTLDEPFQTQLPFIHNNSSIDIEEANFINRSPSIHHEDHFYLPVLSPSLSEDELAGPVTINTQRYSISKQSGNHPSSSNQSWQAAQVVQRSSQASGDFTHKSKKQRVDHKRSKVPPSKRGLNLKHSSVSTGKNTVGRKRQKSSIKQPTGNLIMSSIERPDNVGEDSELVQRPSLPSASISQNLDYYTPMAASRESSSIRDELSAAFSENMTVAEMIQNARREAVAAATANTASINLESNMQSYTQNEMQTYTQNEMLPPLIVDGQTSLVQDAASDLNDLSAVIPELTGVESLDEDVDDSPHLPLRTFGPNEHVVLMPMVPLVRDVYNEEIPKCRREIDSLRKGKQLSPEAMAKVDKLIDNLKLLGDHQDLFFDEAFSPDRMSADTVSKWALTCSSKCQFIERLFEFMRDSNAHVALLARPGKSLDIIEAVLQMHKFRYDRPDRPSRSDNSAHGNLRITLLPTGFDGGQYVISPADAVIAFDSSFFTGERYSRMLRAHTYDPAKKSPLIMLVIEDSAEHLELCLPKSLDPIERKTHLLDFVDQKREVVGMSTEPQPADAAFAVANYLTNNSSNYSGTDFASVWPLSQKLFVSNLDIPDGLLSQQSGSTTQSQDHQFEMTPQVPMSSKRPHEDLTDEDTTKRMRMTPVPPEIVSSGQITRISDSVGQPSQFNDLLTDSAEEAITASAALDDEQSDQITQLLARVADLQIQLQSKANAESRVTDLEAQLRDKEATEARHHNTIATLELKVAEHVSLVNKFNPLYHEALNARRVATVAATEAETRAAALSKKLDARAAELATAKAATADLEASLAAAREAAAGSSVPGVAELEDMRTAKAAAEAERDKLARRLASTAQDFEFTREQYQRASAAAAALGEEVSGLRAEAEGLRRKAAGDVVRVREIQAASEAAQLGERIDEIVVEREALRVEVTRGQEELARLRAGRGRRGVVGGSRSSSQTPGEGGGVPRWMGAGMNW